MNAPTALKAIELKAFVPAKDFALSKRFYADLGFEQRSEGGGVAYFHVDGCPFLLQDFYEPTLADHLVMHLLVPDVQAWFAHVQAQDLAGLDEAGKQRNAALAAVGSPDGGKIDGHLIGLQFGDQVQGQG